MTVELLGTVLGTAIQGQIVGMANAPCLPGPAEQAAAAALSNATTAQLNDSEPVISLEHTVSVGTPRCPARLGRFAFCSS